MIGRRSLILPNRPPLVRTTQLPSPGRRGSRLGGRIDRRCFITSAVALAAGTAALAAHRDAQAATVERRFQSMDFERDCGAVGDAVITPGPTWAQNTIVSGTDNAKAFVNFGNYARDAIAGGAGGVVLNIPPGKYLFNGGDTVNGVPVWQSLLGIRKLIVEGNGAWIQNGYSGPASFQATLPLPIGAGPFVSGLTAYYPPAYLLSANTTPGATTFSCASASRLTVDHPVMLGSLCIMAVNSFPPDMFQFEYAFVQSISGTSVTLDRPIRYEHRTDHPDYSTLSGMYPTGAARVFPLNWANPWPGSNFTAMWDIDHTYNDLTVGQCSKATRGGLPFHQFSGMFLTTNNWKGVGWCESIAMSAVHHSGRFLAQPEIDKQVGSVLWDSCCFATHSLTIQSSTDLVTARNCIFNALSTGAAKNLIVESCDINDFVIGQSYYGLQSEAVINNTHIRAASIPYFWGEYNAFCLLDGALIIPFNGAYHKYHDGVFTISTSDPKFNDWLVVPGETISIGGPRAGSGINVFPCNWGTGVVTEISQSGGADTSLIIKTTLPFARMPPWAGGNIYIFRSNQVRLTGCTGCTGARQASRADALGKKYYEYMEFRFEGLTANKTEHLLNMHGQLTSVQVIPHSVGSNSSATVEVHFLTYDPNNSFTADADAGLFITFNVGQAATVGLDQSNSRYINLHGSSGPVGSDAFTLAGNPITRLPVRVVSYEAGITLVNISSSSDESPVFDLILEFDCGMARTIAPVNYIKGGPVANLNGRTRALAAADRSAGSRSAGRSGGAAAL